MPRRPVTAKVQAASRRNIRRAQLARYRTREPRRLGQYIRNRLTGIRRRFF